MEKKRSTIKFLESQFNMFMLANCLLAVVMIVFGAILYLIPTIAIKTVSIVISLYFSIQGIISIISYLKKDRITLLNLNLLYGIFSILIGLFVILNPFAIASILTVGLGVWLIISGCLKINYSARLKMVKEKAWSLTLAVGIISIIFGLIVILNPFSKLFLIEVVGLFLLVYGVIDLTDSLLLKRRAKNFIKIFK